MTNQQNQNRTITPRSNGFFQDLVDRFRLVGRLMMDNRVNPFLKMLPVATLVYLVSPIDLLSVNPLDDAFVVWAGTTLFVQLCDPAVIEEHMQALNRIAQGQWRNNPSGNAHPSDGEEVEGVYYEEGPNDPNR
jgi:uncharacterized membrane protein YkvA (DUF1232 family)